MNSEKEGKELNKAVVWQDSDEMLELNELFLQGIPDFPSRCPVCSKKSGHVYLHRHDGSHRGGMWAWCSECYSYIHTSIIVPSWWQNPTFIDESKLCGGDAEELEKNASSIDGIVNQGIAKYCFSKDICKNCIRKMYDVPQIGECPKCGNHTLMSRLDGLCLHLKCSSCDFEVIGASFFPSCHNDELEYTVSVCSVEKEHKVRVAKLFGINVNDLLSSLRNDNKIEATHQLWETLTLIKGLLELGVKFEVAPNIVEKYPDLIDCKYLRNTSFKQ